MQVLQEEIDFVPFKMLRAPALSSLCRSEVFNETEVEAWCPVNFDASCELHNSDVDVATVVDNDAENSEPRKAKKCRLCLPWTLSRKVLTIILSLEELVCPCYNQAMHVGKEKRKELELISTHVQVICYASEKHSARSCKQHGMTDRVKVAPMVYPRYFIRTPNEVLASQTRHDYYSRRP